MDLVLLICITSVSIDSTSQGTFGTICDAFDQLRGIYQEENNTNINNTHKKMYDEPEYAKSIARIKYAHIFTYFKVVHLL